jgi:hypothetical protein
MAGSGAGRLQDRADGGLGRGAPPGSWFDIPQGLTPPGGPLSHDPLPAGLRFDIPQGLTPSRGLPSPGFAPGAAEV